MKLLVWIALGSALGGTLRFALDELALWLGVGWFPVATIGINLSGSLLIGYLAGLWADGNVAEIHPHKWHFWMTGLCGSYTTFSAFSWQVLAMIGAGQAQIAGLYASASVGLGLIAVWIGISRGTEKRNFRS